MYLAFEMYCPVFPIFGYCENNTLHTYIVGCGDYVHTSILYERMYSQVIHAYANIQENLHRKSHY